MKVGHDINGNRVLHITRDDVKGRGFSIQTLGNLPETHRLFGQVQPEDLAMVDREVRAYLSEHGTPRQKELFGIK